MSPAIKHRALDLEARLGSPAQVFVRTIRPLDAARRPASSGGRYRLSAVTRVRSEYGPQIAGNRDEDVPALGRVAPGAELPNSRLQHLIGMETCILAQHRMRERGDQRLRRMAEREMPCHQACGDVWRFGSATNADRLDAIEFAREAACLPRKKLTQISPPLTPSSWQRR
jgi:hypothetical protein